LGAAEGRGGRHLRGEARELEEERSVATAAQLVAAVDAEVKKIWITASFVLSGAQIEIGVNITIVGAVDDGGAGSGGGNGQPTIDAGGKSRHFHVLGGIFELDNVRLINGKADKGGSIYSRGTLLIRGSRLESNEATTTAGFLGGGAIFVHCCTTTIISTLLASNKVPSGGGGAVNIYSGVLVLSNASFTGNTAGSGKDIYINSIAHVNRDNSFLLLFAPKSSFQKTDGTYDANIGILVPVYNVFDPTQKTCPLGSGGNFTYKQPQFKISNDLSNIDAKLFPTSTCSLCSIGRFQGETGKTTACEECTIGRYQGETGKAKCINCACNDERGCTNDNSIAQFNK
jgi:hypothetical protein